MSDFDNLSKLISGSLFGGLIGTLFSGGSFAFSEAFSIGAIVGGGIVCLWFLVDLFRKRNKKRMGDKNAKIEI